MENIQEIEKKGLIIIISKKLNVPISVLWTLIVTVFLGIVGYSFTFIKTTEKTNAAIPMQQTQLNQVQSAVTNLTWSQELLKNSMTNTANKVNDISKQQNNDHDVLIEIKAIITTIKNQTK